MKRFIACLLIAVTVLGMLSCTAFGKMPTGTPKNTAEPQDTVGSQSTAESQNNGGELDLEKYREKGLPIAVITMEDGRRIVLELYPDIAPQSVRNFIYLANCGFYDGVIFHRVISGFMIQGGDPDGTGMGGPGYSIKGEFAENGVKNDISHVRGVLSMARANDPDSGGSQFFIVHKSSTFLDGKYAAFGRVVSGMEVVDEIAAVTTNSADRPRMEQKMKSIRVETWGVEYPEPERLGER